MAELLGEFWWAVPAAALVSGWAHIVFEERRTRNVVDRARRGLEGK